MKKASKILTLILVAVLVCGLFSGCAMFGRNATKYRSLTAIKVGNEEITVGKILDTFNNYYSSYSSYIENGYITTDYLLDMTMQSLTNQALKVDAYVTDSSSPTYTHAYADVYHNAEYLTEKEIKYCIDYTKHVTFETFDESVLTLLKVDREIGDEETEDTSRDFLENDDLGDATTYAEYIYNNGVYDDEVSEYFDKYYSKVTRTYAADVNDYVFETADAAEAMLKAINDRIEKESDYVTYTELKQAQEKVVKQYRRNIKNTYNLEFEDFMTNQISDMVASVIVSKYNLKINATIESTNFQTTALPQLNENLKKLTDAQIANFALSGNYESFVEGLTNDSYIYNVPADYAGKYIFVKNVLVPFTDQQKKTLENLLKDVGNNTDDETYIAQRNKYASDIIADNFNDKQDDGYGKVSGLFTYDVGSQKLTVAGDLLNYLNTDGTVKTSDGKTADQVIVELMQKYNTDTAQHSTRYDYVVRVGSTPAGYQHSWVTEFVDAANEAWDDGNGINHYALAISTYGVHIVYYSADVVAQEFDFAANYLKTDKPEYRMFKTYFSEQSSLLLEKGLDDLTKNYLDNNKIVINDIFDTFLKDNDFTYDLLKTLSGDSEE